MQTSQFLNVQSIKWNELAMASVYFVDVLGVIKVSLPDVRGAKVL
jgi:hypothetical protein